MNQIELAGKYVAAGQSLVVFRALFLPSERDVRPSPAHVRWSDIILHGTKHCAVEAFRESGKTQIALRANILHALTFPQEHRSFLVILRSTKEAAAALLREISREWQSRPDLMTQPDGMPQVVEDSGNALEVHYPGGRKVRIVTSGRGGAIRGLSWGAKRPDLIVCDDLQDVDDMGSETITKADWDWFLSDVYFLGRDSRIFLIGNNLGERCIIERVINDAEAWGFDWERLPVLDENGESTWPARFPTETVEAERDAFAKVGRADVWWREKMCVSRTPEAQPFRREMFRYAHPATIRTNELNVYMTVDLASSKADSADYSVCAVTGVNRDGHWFVLDCWYGRVTPAEHLGAIFQMYEKWRPLKVGVEKVAYQAAMFDMLKAEMPRRNTFFTVTPLNAVGKKETRISALQPRFAAGSVWFPSGASWLEEMESELLAFPAGKHDDLIDALAYTEQLAQPPRPDGWGNVNFAMAGAIR